MDCLNMLKFNLFYTTTKRWFPEHTNTNTIQLTRKQALAVKADHIDH